jgi:hypothetical protein
VPDPGSRSEAEPNRAPGSKPEPLVLVLPKLAEERLESVVFAHI